ncbi:MAG TPA: RNA polymerase sigma factor [Planctomycetota bacterium]|nr:RNA polymerase sigma factor [Planctomycetota bacterium]
MTSQNPMLSPEFLAEHQHFVQRLARGLARDEAAALDLAQETWLATLASGSQAIVRPRAWLATAMRRRALNLARSESVRREHETRSARDEASEDASLHDRVSCQHSIVAEVLQLDEPYRSVVLLRYFQDLSPAAIARRRKVPAATVRSQLARAHAQLRERLERREGGREAWCLALAGFLEHSKPALVSAKVLAIAAGVCVSLGAGATAWMVMRATTTRASEGIVIAETPPSSAGELQPEFASSRHAILGIPEAPPPVALVLEDPSSEVLEGKSVDELRDMLIRVEDELRPRLMNPSPEVIAAWRSAHPDDEMEFARVLDRPTSAVRSASGVVGLRGEGAFFSFATRSNSYDDGPTIYWEQGALKSLGNSVLVDFGGVDPAGVPAGLSPDDAGLFTTLSAGPALPANSAQPALRELLADRSRTRCPMILQHTYLIRHALANEHDVLAVFVPIQQDAFGITFAWRLLKSWPVPDLRTVPLNIKPRANLSPEPWTAPMSIEGLLSLVDRIRAITTRRLITIPDALRQEWPNRPLGRVLRDYWATRYVDIDGGGRFFNFATESNSYQGEPEIDLYDENFGVQFHPDGAAWIFDVGETSVLAVGPSFALPEDEHVRVGWELAWTFERRTPAASGSGALIVTPAERQQFLDYRQPVRAVLHHSYVVRSIIPGSHDYLVAFEILAEDEHGIFITWRVLKTWPA